MATGYEVDMYHNIHEIQKQLFRIANSLETIAKVTESETDDQLGIKARRVRVMKEAQ